MESKRHVVRVAEDEMLAVTYECGLGERGKGCVVPIMYQLAYEGTLVGRVGDDASSRCASS